MLRIILRPILLFVFPFTVTSVHAEMMTLSADTDSDGNQVFSRTIDLAPGDVCRALSAQFDDTSSKLYFCVDGDVGCSPIRFSESEVNDDEPIVVGPASVYLIARGPAYADAMATVEVIRAEDTINEAIPESTVVIPTSASGDVRVILESSTDLVNWSSANPGTYSAGTDKRFFRIRTEVVE